MVHSDNEVSVLRNGGSGAPGITLGSNGGAGGGLEKSKVTGLLCGFFRRDGWTGRIWGEQRRREGGKDQGGSRLPGCASSFYPLE